MKDIKKEFKAGDRVVHRYFGRGNIICLIRDSARIVFDRELAEDVKSSQYYDKVKKSLLVPTVFLSHINVISEQTDLVRLNSRFTTNQELTMDKEIAMHGMELQTIIITTQLVDLSLSVNATMKNYNVKNLYDLADKMAGAYIAIEELKKMWQIDDETIDELIDKKMGEIKKKMEE